jgi:hypothetical protein
MSQNFYTRLALVILIVLWSLYEVYPPTNRDLIEHFQARAVKRDLELSNIVYQARELRKTHPDRAYGNLQEAIGTNDITKYFPFFEPRGEPQPNLFVLNRLQREALGRLSWAWTCKAARRSSSEWTRTSFFQRKSSPTAWARLRCEPIRP